MKKYSILMIILCIAGATYTQANDIGLQDIVFEQQTISTTNHGFFINEISYTLLEIHMLIAGKTIESANYQSEALIVTKKLEELTKTDVIDLLSVSVNKQETLAEYLNNCYQFLQKGDTISTYIKQEINIIKGDINACLKEKELSDKMYFDAIDDYDQNTMQQALNESTIKEICATENRIQYNAKTSIARKLVFYLGVLQKKYDVLTNKQDILTKNFDIFRDDILPELNEINALLKQYKF